MAYDLDQETRRVSIVDETADVTATFTIIVPTPTQRIKHRSAQQNFFNNKNKLDLEKVAAHYQRVAARVVIGLDPPTQNEDGTYKNDGYMAGGLPLSSNPKDPGYKADWLERLQAKRGPIITALINEVFEERAMIKPMETTGADPDGGTEAGAAESDDPLA